MNVNMREKLDLKKYRPAEETSTGPLWGTCLVGNVRIPTLGVTKHA